MDDLSDSLYLFHLILKTPYNRNISPKPTIRIAIPPVAF